MITFSKLGKMGRLGNQLFQIAVCESLAKDNNDIAVFKKWDYNHLLVNKVNIGNVIVEHTYNEKSFSYNKIEYKNNLDLNGYFQSEKYFISNSDHIRNLFKYKNENSLKDKWSKYLAYKTCSMHIRRGDYLRLADHHPVQTIDYYLEAINIIGTNCYYLIFSDDIEWCKSKFKGDNFIFVENQNEFEDLFLMSYCNDNIIANSSFSWWGSWLNSNENKKIIAPKVWFGKKKTEHGIYANDIYTNKMIII